VTHNPFAGRTTLILGVPEVCGLLTMADTLEVQRAAFMAAARGTVTASPNAWLRLPDQERRRGWLKILAGHEASSGSLGVKVLARFADNPPGTNLGSLVLLFDETDGFPLAIMDGVLITGMRTGAGAGLATAALAAPSASEIGVVGTGVVAWYSLQAALLARPGIERVRVYSRSPERRAQLARRVIDELGVAAEPADSVESAVLGADVVITATNSSGPVLEAEHLEPGQHINAMGIRHEVSAAALARTWIVPDGVSEATDDGKFSVALAAGVLAAEDIGPDLGTVLSTPGSWHRPGEISLFDSSGVAVQDVTLARHVLELALAKGVGTRVDLGLGTGPL
jgi:alanine dehydrogenase